MTATALWIGPADRPMFGWLHVPDDGRARAGVVLCPSLGEEYLDGHPAIQALAIRLERRGFAVLRVDYPGTGDSAGRPEDQGWVEAMLDGIRSARALLHDVGCPRTAMVGLRIGAVLAATVAASATADGHLDALVLWDPCATGRSYQREARALQSLRLDGMAIAPPPTAGGGDTQAHERLELEDLGIASTPGPLADRVLALTRVGRPLDRNLAERLTLPHVEWRQVTGQAELLDVGNLDARIPVETLDQITDWLAGQFPPATSPVQAPSALVAEVGDGVIERIRSVAPLGLFAIAAEPAAGASGPAVVFLNSAIKHHVGPSRLWVELARRLAAAGMRTLRVDLAGLGDSPQRPEVGRHLAYALEAVDDIVDVARDVSPDDPGHVVLVGLCSGARQAIEAGTRLAARGVCAINPPLTFKPEEVPSEGIDPRVRAGAGTKLWVLKVGHSRPVAALFHRLPPCARRTLDTRNERSPVRPLERLVDAGANALLLCGDDDARRIEESAEVALRRLTTSGRLRYQVIAGVDHGLLVRAGREALADALVEHILSSWGRPGGVVPLVDRSSS